MELIKKLKEVVLSVLPIVAIASILGIVFDSFIDVSLFQFLLSSLLVVIGLTFFLFGVDMAFLPLGN